MKKEWYDVKTPIMFNGDQRLIGKTPVTKTAGKSELLAAWHTHNASTTAVDSTRMLTQIIA